MEKSEQKVEVKKARAICYRVYDYLCKYNVGRKNSIKAHSLARIFAISTRDLRDVLNEINLYSFFDKIICRDKGIYVAENSDEALSYIETAKHRAISIFYEAYTCENKHKRAGQYKIPFGEYYKSSCETYAESHKD